MSAQLALTFEDHKRLGKQMAKVRDFALQHLGEPLTLRQLSDATGAPEASVSARIRDLRGLGFHVKTERAGPGRGLHVYTVTR